MNSLSFPKLHFARLFLLVNGLSMTAVSADRSPAPCLAGSRKAGVTSGWTRNRMRSSHLGYRRRFCRNRDAM